MIFNLFEFERADARTSGAQQFYSTAKAFAFAWFFFWYGLCFLPQKWYKMNYLIHFYGYNI